MKKFKIDLTTSIVIAMVLGMIAGYLFPQFMIDTKFIGDVFLRLIQMSIVVLVMGAVIEAVGSLKISELGRLGGKTLAGFMVTTLFASYVGIVIANVLEPGKHIAASSEALDQVVKTVETPSVSKMITDFFPSNIVGSLASGNTIQVIIFSILFGVALATFVEQTGDESILNFVKNINQILLNLVKMVIKVAPIGIFSLLGWTVATYGYEVIKPLLSFLFILIAACVLLSLFFIFITAAVTRLNPFRLISKLMRTMMVALTTTSSAVTLPVEMEDCETKIGISKRVNRLVMPLGMSMNSNGTAMYLAMASITIAQFFGYEMQMVTQFKVVIMSTLAVLGTIVVPGGGLVALAIVLPTIGLPLEGIALLAGIDWFAGAFRTLLNVVTDVTVGVWVAATEGELNRDIFNSDVPVVQE